MLSNLIVFAARFVLLLADWFLYAMATVCASAVWLVQRFGTEDQVLTVMRRYLPTAVGAVRPQPAQQGVRIVRLRAPELTELGRKPAAGDDDLPN